MTKAQAEAQADFLNAFEHERICLEHWPRKKYVVFHRWVSSTIFENMENGLFCVALDWKIWKPEVKKISQEELCKMYPAQDVIETKKDNTFYFHEGKKLRLKHWIVAAHYVTFAAWSTEPCRFFDTNGKEWDSTLNWEEWKAPDISHFPEQAQSILENEIFAREHGFKYGPGERIEFKPVGEEKIKIIPVGEIIESDEEKVEKARGLKYGDFELNMVALTRIIESMVSQATQNKTVLPDNFGALVLVAVKNLRECHKHDEDNGLDAHNYLDVARRIGRKV